MKLRVFCCALLLGFLGMGYAQEQEEPGDYQRYDVVREPSELTLEAGFHYRMETLEGEDMYSLIPSVRTAFTFASHHTFELSLPYTLSFYENQAARQRIFYALGDLQLSYEYLFQRGHSNWFLRPFVTFPLTGGNAYALREGVLSGGTGRYQIGAEASVTGIRDPVVWNLGFQYGVGLPKEDRFSTSWQPGNMRLSAGITDLINDRFGFALSLYQSLGLPALADGLWDKGGLSVSTLARLEVFALFDHDYVRVSLDMYAYPLYQPITVGIVYGHQFILRKKEP